MSVRLPSVKPIELIRALEKAGWYIDRQRGSHVVMYKPGAPTVVVIPVHKKDVPRGTLSGILKDAGLTNEEFIRLLKKG